VIPFAVQIEGVTGNRATWVLVVSGNRVLVAVGGKLAWYSIDKCTFIGFKNPEDPLPVVPVAPKGKQIAIARPGQGF